MKFAIVFVALVAVALAKPVDDAANAQVIRFNSDVGAEGYNFDFETSDGVSRQETGELKNVGTDEEAIVVRGTYKWIADDGQEYSITFVADENGFQPEGAHIPKA